MAFPRLISIGLNFVWRALYDRIQNELVWISIFFSKIIRDVIRDARAMGYSVREVSDFNGSTCCNTSRAPWSNL